MNCDILLGGIISIATIIVTKIADYFIKSRELKGQLDMTKVNNQFSFSKSFFERKMIIAEKAIIYFNSFGNTLGLLSQFFEMLPNENSEIDDTLSEFYADSLSATIEHLTKPENEIVNAISLSILT